MATEGYATFDYLLERDYAPVRCWIEPTNTDVVAYVPRHAVIGLLSHPEMTTYFSRDEMSVIHDHSVLNGYVTVYPSKWRDASKVDPSGLPAGDYFVLKGLSLIWAKDGEYADVFGEA